MIMITTKQRAYLRGLANSAPAILQVGKDGITPALVENILVALAARELVKVSVLETAPLSAKEAIAEVMAGIPEAEAVQVIGRKFVLYRQNKKEPKIVLPR